MAHDHGALLAGRLDHARAVVAHLEVRLLEVDGMNLRLAPAVATAIRVFADNAPQWWSRPAFGLEWRVPRTVALEGDHGRERVIRLLGQIEYGTYV